MWKAESSSGDGYIGKNVINEDLISRSDESRRLLKEKGGRQYQPRVTRGGLV
jgi:hypothetical protein